jgi:hypothetical protein
MPADFEAAMHRHDHERRSSGPSKAAAASTVSRWIDVIVVAERGL